MKRGILISFLVCSLNFLFGQNNSDDDEFAKLNLPNQWEKVFDDDCTGEWQKKWFLDGVRAEVKNSNNGMLFTAGPIDSDNACNAVLWTKDSFRGDIKIEFDYIRTDTRNANVNILYIQATGTGTAPYSKDISEWNNLRIIPYMYSYFRNMNTLHISYAAFENENSKGVDYIRVRKYPVKPGADFNKTTEIQPAIFQTGLFVPGITYKFIVIKSGTKLFFKVENKDISKLYSWDLSSVEPVTEGRVGIRHMHTRSAIYKDFKIFTR